MTAYCEQCGAPLKPEARFCPKCGTPVQTAYTPAEPSIPPAQIMGDPYSPASEASSAVAAPQRSRRGCWIAGIVLAVAACCAVLVCGVGAVALYNLDAGLPTTQLEIPAATTIPLLPTLAPTSEPVLPPTSPPLQPTTLPSELTAGQKLSETEFYDDFSSSALDWYTSTDDNSQVGYENGGYAMEVKTPDYRTLVRPPVQYLTHLEFNAQVVQGADRGTFGVACYYVDLSNYSFVEFNMVSREFHFGRIDNGQWIDLDDWRSFSASQEPLRFAVECTPGLMALYINDDPIAELPVVQPVQPHEMWLVVATWSDSASGGIKVLFDDMYGYRAMQ